MKKSLVLWQFMGFAFAGALGTLLHFVFDWSSQNIIVGFFSAVNESIWEHMKLLYFPMVIFAIIQYHYFKNEYKNFWCSKLIGLLLGLLIIPTLYYTYTGALGVKADWFNILIFFISSAISFWVETQIIKNSRSCNLTPTVSKLIIIFIGLLFVIFTLVPPHIPLFIDPIDSTYGYFKII